MFRLENVTVGYKEKKVLSDISVAFPEGKVTTIIGKNGCGKSTLLKACVGLITVNDGKILLRDRNLQEYDPRSRAREIAYMAQHKDITNLSVQRMVLHGRFPHMTAPRKIQESDLQIVDRALEETQLLHLREQPLSRLSGGERQRAYLAMQLAQDSQIYFWDEPTTYMDIDFQLSFLHKVQELKLAGKTIIMVLHDISQALSYSDHILVLDRGRLIQQGTPDEIIGSGTIPDVFNVDVHEMIKQGNRHYCLIKRN